MPPNTVSQPVNEGVNGQQPDEVIPLQNHAINGECHQEEVAGSAFPQPQQPVSKVIEGFVTRINIHEVQRPEKITVRIIPYKLFFMLVH